MGDRHQFRAIWHDYNGGIYFVTICAYEKEHIFGRILDNVFYPTEIGKIVIEQLNNLTFYHSDVELWNSVVMPNHIHIVIAVEPRLIMAANDVNSNLGCLKPKNHGEECGDFHHNSRLASIIGSFKAGVSRTVRTRRIASLPVWQSRYHEHIIKNQRSFENIMNYIDTNIENWHSDCFAK